MTEGIDADAERRRRRTWRSAAAARFAMQRFRFKRPSFPPSLLPSFLPCLHPPLFTRRRHFLYLAHSRRANWLFPLPFRFSSKDFVPRLRETREIHPACKTLFPSTRMTNAREKRGRAGGDATRVTGSNFRHDLADYNRAPPPPPSFPSPSPLSRGKPSVLRHSRLTTARAGN